MLRSLIKLAHAQPELRADLLPLIRKYAQDESVLAAEEGEIALDDDGLMGGRQHAETGKGYGMTGPDRRGKGKWAPEAKSKCYYETRDPADRCYVTRNGGPGGQKSKGPALKKKDWKGYEKKRWGK